MILIPAIDLKGGHVVRLFQGKFSDVTEYGDDPLAFAKKWVDLGAQWLHLVDLDGAKDGVMVNRKIIAQIARGVNVPVEVGGGIRNEATVRYLLEEAKVARVILGTKAIEDREFLRQMLALYGEKICVSIDCANGLVTQRGWVSTTAIRGVDLAHEFELMGLQWVVYTDIARDGTLMGPNFKEIENLVNHVGMNVIASGGIGSLDDVKKLKNIKGVKAAITGKAIYEGKLDFKEALSC